MIRIEGLPQLTDSIYKAKGELVNSFREYTPDSLLEEGEWYGISSFSHQTYTLDLVQDGYENIDLKDLERNAYERIEFLFVNSDESLYFQRVGRTRLTKKKNFLRVFGDSFEYIHDAKVFTFNEYPDAIYTRNNDTLYFRNFDKAAGIFDGMIDLYREATEAEVTSFLESEFILLANGFHASQVKTRNRKRILLATDILSSLKDAEKEKMFSYVKEYCPSLVAENQKITIGSENDLKMLLYGIQERFYTTPVGEEKRIANASISWQNPHLK